MGVVNLLTLDGAIAEPGAGAATAGRLGEVISATAGAVALTNAAQTDICFIDLTAGDWEVSAGGEFTPAAGTVVTKAVGAISLTSASASAISKTAKTALPLSTTGGGLFSYHVGSGQVSAAGTTRVYLTVRVDFTVSTCTGGGTITARRAR